MKLTTLQSDLLRDVCEQLEGAAGVYSNFDTHRGDKAQEHLLALSAKLKSEFVLAPAKVL